MTGKPNVTLPLVLFSGTVLLALLSPAARWGVGLGLIAAMVVVLLVAVGLHHRRGARAEHARGRAEEDAAARGQRFADDVETWLYTARH